MRMSQGEFYIPRFNHLGDVIFFISGCRVDNMIGEGRGLFEKYTILKPEEAALGTAVRKCHLNSTDNQSVLDIRESGYCNPIEVRCTSVNCEYNSDHSK